jgi:hypothetical protein
MPVKDAFEGSIKNRPVKRFEESHRMAKKSYSFDNKPMDYAP